ncbi:hypothetical protein RIF29_41695 [Crotalaria pallida]|uniref:Kinetochore protein NDC80 n=1 Tax=Crotalaria pallida TaxID=3830 RepID=A0AAN9HPM2_CROPI
MRPTRRQNKDSFIPPPTPPDFPYPHPHHHHFPSRDSDASSRPSTAGAAPRSSTFDLYKDRSFQQSAISSINSFLSSHNFHVIFKSSSFPSAKDIHETLRFLLSLLSFHSSSKLEDDLPLLLKRLHYPFKLNKSILKSPAAPHQWPTLLALIHWLVQLARFDAHLASSTNTMSSMLRTNLLHQYTVKSYIHFIAGDDDAVEDLDRNVRGDLERQREIAEEKAKDLAEEAKRFEAELERERSAPSRKDALEKEKALLEEDVGKFHSIIEKLRKPIEETRKAIAEKEKEVEAKVEENRRIVEENEELKRRVEAQTFNARDVERMKRELQAVERDIGEAELARNAWEDKSWEIDNSLGHKFKDLEALAMDCNQALKRLKVGNGIQYQLNSMGTMPAEIMGIDHKLTLKPALNSFADDIKKSSMAKSEELISYQQKSNAIAVRIEEKRNHIAAVQSRIDEMEAQLNMKKKEAQDYRSRCSADAKAMSEDVQIAVHDLNIMEREAADVLKASELKLQEAMKQSEEDIQMHARELFKLVDSVSKYKEHVSSKISEMNRALSETATAVSDAYKGSLPAQFGDIFNTTPK